MHDRLDNGYFAFFVLKAVFLKIKIDGTFAGLN